MPEAGGGDNLAVAHARPVDGLLSDEERDVHRMTVVGGVLAGLSDVVSRGKRVEALA